MQEIISGKLSPRHLKEFILNQTGKERPEVRTGPALGVDVAVIDLPGEQALVCASDPLSLLPDLGLQESAWLSLCLLSNDMASSGLPAQYAQFVFNLPDHLNPADFKQYWGHIDAYCKDMGIAVTGGHTGFLPGLDTTVIGGGTFMSTGPRSQVLVSSGARAGDVLLLTKGCAISSTALLAMSFPATVRDKIGNELFLQACELFYQTGAACDAEWALGASARQRAQIHAMHDVTEGGVLGAAREFAQAAGLGLRLEQERIPLGQAQKKIGELFGFNPRHTIGAGAMLIAVSAGEQQEVVRRLQEGGIPCFPIGEFKDAAFGVRLESSQGVVEVPELAADPYWAAYFTAKKEGWK